jgi:NAD(P)-dependent dehydrogenase (short-subunit alcohol dehydrogenase family)
MSRGILIAGNESSLLTALCVEAAKRVENYAVAFIPQANDAAKALPGDKRILIDWNPSSPISAKTLVLSCLNKINSIDDALLVCAPPAYRIKPEELSAAEVNQLVDCNIKSWFFLVKELTAAFKKQGKGHLALIMASEPGHGSKEDNVDLLGPISVSAFRSFAQGVLISSFNALYDVMGFSQPEPGEENAFAAHVFKTMEEGKKNSGKWHKYAKFGFLGR